VQFELHGSEAFLNRQADAGNETHSIAEIDKLMIMIELYLVFFMILEL
jgi:hypothetical protein